MPMKERIIYTNCPLCESKEFHEIGVADCSHHPLYQNVLSKKMVWNLCKKCDHIFTNGYFTEEACEIIFSVTQENQQLGHDIERNRTISAKMIDKVLPYISHGIWIDVGIGNGSLLFTAEEYGFKAIGLDLREKNVENLKSIGFEAYCQDIAELKLSEKCSVISMMDVLEHMPYPKKGLQAAHRLLKNDGVLFISMPNIESILWKIMNQQNMNPYWGEIEHYHNFGRLRLYALLEEFGFKAVQYGISERYKACMEVIAIKKNI